MSIYRSYSPEQLESLFSSYLVNSWSYSRITQFARNEKAFEMQYIYGLSSRKSATTVAGNALHEAIAFFFNQLKEGNLIDVVEMEKSAFQYIENVPANTWKMQKTTPTIEECIAKAITTAAALVRNFYAEKETYLSNIAEVLAVELNCEEFITVNGVDIPLPCNAYIDLVVRTKAGKIAVVDHKSKDKYTDDAEMQLAIGVQAMTYILVYEAKTGQHVDEVWFVENKYSQNKDKSPQLHKYCLVIDEDTRRLYESLLYEPLRRMVAAVSDPDYVYLINDSDNYTERAEVYNFWCRTMIAEVDDFNVDESKKELVAKRLKKVRDASIAAISPNVIRNFKENASAFIQYDLSNKNMTPEEKIEHVLRSFGTIVRVAHKFEGYSSNTYLLEVSAGVKVSSIYQYRLDIANALDVTNVRIAKELTVYDGKSYLPIDFTRKRDRFLYFDPSELVDQKIPLGKDNFNQTIVWDLNNESTPHMLVCGTTGSGKSVFLQSTIEYALRAGVEDIIVLDPKFEFKNYRRKNVEVINDIRQIEEKMKELVDHMQQLVREGRYQKTLVIFDEFADAVANSRKGAELDIKEMVQVGTYAPKKGFLGMIEPGAPKMRLQKTGELKSLEENMRILLQKGRSVGFRIIAALQRASTKIITGDAKVNFPVQVCFRVQKEIDSRVVLDEPGAESLSDKGDGLIKSPEYRDTVRFQAFYYDPNRQAAMAEHDSEVNATIVQEMPI